jgi:hypothetical protein
MDRPDLAELGPQAAAVPLAELRGRPYRDRLAVSLNFRQHELFFLHDHPGAGRDLSQP